MKKNRSGAMWLTMAVGFAIVGSARGVADEAPTSLPRLGIERVATGLDRPLVVTAPPGDDRIFIAEQRGAIRILEGRRVLPAPFLDLDPIVVDGGGRGLLGLAFAPDYATSGRFYVHYNDNDSATVIARYVVSESDPNRADPDSGEILLTFPQPAAVHNGGAIAFSPRDGYLYLGFGDGTGARDPFNHGQDDSVFYSKLLRIDVSGPSGYMVPPDNPNVGLPGFDEIWAKGLRNPWRFSFDRDTGDLYIADVGQADVEEIDVQPADAPGGANYGWRCMEGSTCTGLGGCDCEDPNLVLPTFEYPHENGNCSVIGGHVYRGAAIPSLHGHYFFADHCTGEILSFRWTPFGTREHTRWTNELVRPNGHSLDLIASFGEDAAGEIYLCDLADGEIYRIVDADARRLDRRPSK